MSNIKKKTSTESIVAILIGMAIVWGVWTYYAFHPGEGISQKVAIERESWYEISINGKAIAYYNSLDSDSVFTRIDTTRRLAIRRTTGNALWVNRYWFMPSCKGRLAANMDSLQQPTFNTNEVIAKNIESLAQKISNFEVMSDEMEYFFHTHNVQDEGYELVTAEYEKTQKDLLRYKKVLEQLKEIENSTQATVTHKALYKVSYRNAEDSLVTDTAIFDGKHFQLKSHKTPKKANPLSYFDSSTLGLKRHVIKQKTEQTTPTDGFGLKVSAEKGVQLGEWKDGKFKGERLEYNTNRIYGIDIARYQHERGRKRYAINWQNLRISSLGTLSKKRINGVVDYPVSFVYIKATEGTNILNRYYTTDYYQARKYGKHVGSYHFFSTKSSGAQQAKHFLRHLHIQKGDLPPVIDIEPSAAQIARMGGIEKLFQEVRVWIKAVEAKTGMHPVLYINQGFVNKYLSLAPDLKANYNVWIARYGEYKPDVHMLFWQLSPDGRVKGITPEVDINVFNGYQERFDEFIRTHTKQ